MSGLFIFLILRLPGVNFSWWGTQIYTNSEFMLLPFVPGSADEVSRRLGWLTVPHAASGRLRTDDMEGLGRSPLPSISFIPIGPPCVSLSLVYIET
jgi:hypothetical protein